MGQFYMEKRDINPGNLVKVEGLRGHYKVISIEDVSTGKKIELLSLADNQIRTILSPPYTLIPLLSPLELAMIGRFEPSNRFNLFIEANRLSLVHLYDPLASLSATKIDILPHQVEAVYRMIKSYWPNFLLADDAGLGKTIMAGMLIKELELRKRIARVLIVVPAALQYQWKRELMEKFREKFVIMDSAFRNSYYVNNPYGNPWVEYNYVIISMDFAKRKDVLEELKHIEWDLTIVDEAHKMAAHRFGAKIARTKRYILGEELRATSNSLLFLTATPHSGESYAFFRLISLLDPYMFLNEMELNKVKLKRIMIRRLKEDCKDLDNKDLFPPREAKTITVKFAGDEKKLYDHVVEYVTHYFNLARKERNRGVSFAMTILQKRMASSVYAITRSLENRLGRLKELREIGDLLQERYEDREFRELESQELTTEDLEEKEKEAAEKRFEVLTMARNVKELEEEISYLKRLVSIARSTKSDSKADELIKFVKNILLKNPKEKVLIFTEYTDTLDYLVNRLRELNYKLAIIHGGINPQERVSQEELFKSDETPIMVATEAAGEGINLQFAHIMVNYELPWNPNRLEQRIGRLHRYGQKKKVFIYNMSVQDTIEGRIFQRLLDKVDAIKQEMGDRVFDVLGVLLSGVKLEDLVMEAVGKDAKWIESKIEEVADQLDDAKRAVLEVIEKNSLIKDTLDIASVKKLLGESQESSITEYDIERFMRLFLSLHGGKLNNLSEPSLFSIDLPKALYEDRSIRDSLYIYGYEFTEKGKKPFTKCMPITFSKQVSKEKDSEVRFVALGHPLISRMIGFCQRSDFGGRVSVKLDPHGKSGALFVFRSRIISGDGDVRGERLIPIFWDKRAETFMEVDPVAIWNFEDVKDVSKVKSFDSGILLKAFRKAEGMAIQQLADLLEDVSARVKREVTIKIDDMNRYQQKAKDLLMKRISEAERHARFYAFDKDEPKRIKRRIGRYQATLKRLSTSLKENMEALEKEMKLVYEAPELLGIAVINPKETFACRKMEHPRTHEIELIEKAGLALSLEYERSCDRRPEDVSMKFKGYDIISEGKNEKRFIEVKSFKDTGSLEITGHEWIVSEKLGDNYWLYIVEHALDPKSRSLYRIRNPCKTFAHVATRKSILQFKIVVVGWKEVAGSTWKRTYLCVQ